MVIDNNHPLARHAVIRNNSLRKAPKIVQELVALAKQARYPIFQDHYGGGFALYDNKHFATAEALSAYIKLELFKQKGKK